MKKAANKEVADFVALMHGKKTYTDFGKVIQLEIEKEKQNVIRRRQYNMIVPPYITDLKREARTEGIQVGITQGALQKARETAKRMLQKGFQYSDIAELLGLSIDEIEQL